MASKYLHKVYKELIITGTGVCSSCRFFNCHAASQRYFVGSSCDEAPEKDASATVVQWLDAEDTLRRDTNEVCQVLTSEWEVLIGEIKVFRETAKCIDRTW